MDWRKREEWIRRGDGFCVLVKHWTEQMPEPWREEGQHRWGVYAYIYPKHPLFGKFDGDGIYQTAAQEMPLHGGATLFRRNYSNDGKECCSVEIGADYHHDGDAHFTHYENDEDAFWVFSDANELVRWLSDCKSNPTGQTRPTDGGK